MPLTATDEPGTADAFGVRFTMKDRDAPIRCHVVASVLGYCEEHPPRNEEEQLGTFTRNRKVFERVASDLYDAGHRTPWVSLLSVERATITPQG